MDVRARLSGAAVRAICAAAILGSCVHAGADREPIAFVTPEGERLDPPALLARARWTVLVFYSPTCHCVAAHEGRLAALQTKYAGRAVQFFWVDSEAGASDARDAAEARRRGLTFPILVDPGARAAHRFDARYASDSLVLDAAGAMHYHGGIDSDRDYLRDNATRYLEDALDDLVAGREPRRPAGPALGCSLQTW